MSGCSYLSVSNEADVDLNVRSFKVTGNIFTSQTMHYGFVDITIKMLKANVLYNSFMISYGCLKKT